MSSPADLLEFACPHCQQIVQASPELVGERIQCGHCEKRLKVPGTRKSHSPSEGGAANPLSAYTQSKPKPESSSIESPPLLHDGSQAAAQEFDDETTSLPKDDSDDVPSPGIVLDPSLHAPDPFADDPFNLIPESLEPIPTQIPVDQATDQSASRRSKLAEPEPSDMKVKWEGIKKEEIDTPKDSSDRLLEPADENSLLPTNEDSTGEVETGEQEEGASDAPATSDSVSRLIDPILVDRPSVADNAAKETVNEDSSDNDFFNSNRHDSFSMRCDVCDSVLYAFPSQIGTSIKCGDCFSMVQVVKSKLKPLNLPKSAIPVDDSDFEYRLQDDGTDAKPPIQPSNNLGPSPALPIDDSADDGIEFQDLGESHELDPLSDSPAHSDEDLSSLESSAPHHQPQNTQPQNKPPNTIDQTTSDSDDDIKLSADEDGDFLLDPTSVPGATLAGGAALASGAAASGATPDPTQQQQKHQQQYIHRVESPEADDEDLPDLELDPTKDTSVPGKSASAWGSKPIHTSLLEESKDGAVEKAMSEEAAKPREFRTEISVQYLLSETSRVLTRPSVLICLIVFTLLFFVSLALLSGTRLNVQAWIAAEGTAKIAPALLSIFFMVIGAPMMTVSTIAYAAVTTRLIQAVTSQDPEIDIVSEMGPWESFMDSLFILIPCAAVFMPAMFVANAFMAVVYHPVMWSLPFIPFFVILPVPLFSALKNESPFKIIEMDVIRSISEFRPTWLHLVGVSGVVTVVAVFGVIGHSFDYFIVNFLVALVVVPCMFAYFSMVGLTFHILGNQLEAKRLQSELEPPEEQQPGTSPAEESNPEATQD